MVCTGAQQQPDPLGSSGVWIAPQNWSYLKAMGLTCYTSMLAVSLGCGVV